jgi:putative oxidoreductase
MMSALLSNLGLDSGLDILRVVCGLFLLPHLVVKFRNQEFVKGFMTEAGLKPPGLWLYAAFAVEIVTSIGLIFDIYARYAAILAGIFLAVAAYASWIVSKRKWMWNFGGAEYPLFWAICCFIVAAAPATP